MMSGRLTKTILFFVFLNTLQAQDVYLEAEKAYGPDPLLFNGKKYTFYLPPDTEGHPFYRSEEFVAGKVFIGENAYETESINFDLFNQEILLKYKSENGATVIISLSRQNIGGFSLEEVQFRLLSLPGQPEAIYQVIGTDGLAILIHWKKTFRLDMGYGSSHYVFSPAEKQSYLLKSGEYHSFGNKKSFLAAFGPEDQPAIRRYLKSNHVKLKKADDRSLNDLLTYCGGLSR